MNISASASVSSVSNTGCELTSSLSWRGGGAEAHSLGVRIAVAASSALDWMDRTTDRMGAVLAHRAHVIVGKATTVVRRIVRLWTACATEFPCRARIIKVAGALRLLGWVKALAGLLSIKSMIKNTVEDAQLGDTVGVVQDVAMTALEGVDVCDGVFSGWAGCVALGVLETLPVMELIGLPIAVVLNMGKGTKRVVSIVRTRNFIDSIEVMEEQLSQKVTGKDYMGAQEVLIRYLESEVGITEEELRGLHVTAQKLTGTLEEKRESLQKEVQKFLRRKFKAVELHADSEIAEQLQRLYLLLLDGQLEGDNVDEIQATFDAVKVMLNRKVGVKTAGLVGCVVMLTTLILLAAGVLALAGVVILGLVSLFKLALVVYEKYFQHRGVTYPQLERVFNVVSSSNKNISEQLIEQQMDRQGEFIKNI